MIRKKKPVKAKEKQGNCWFYPSEKPITLSAWSESGAADPLIALQSEVGELMKKLAEARQGHYESERRNWEETERVLCALLEVQDAFDRIFSRVDERKDQITKQMEIWLGNFRTVSRLVQKILEIQGVARIEHITQVFDPQWHIASETLADASKDDGTILEIVLNGYVWNGRILRKAEVKVVRNGADTVPEHQAKQGAELEEQ